MKYDFKKLLSNRDLPFNTTKLNLWYLEKLTSISTACLMIGSDFTITYDLVFVDKLNVSLQVLDLKRKKLIKLIEWLDSTLTSMIIEQLGLELKVTKK